MNEKIHMIKLVVGFDSLEQFRQWQAREYTVYKGQKANLVRTRFEPKRKDEILASGGSIYRVISKMIRCRQQILGFDEVVTRDRGKQCIILTSTEIVPTEAVFKKPFQGWRYFKQDAVPADLTDREVGDGGSHELAAELKELGLL